ncbi:MAG: hypothetical protein AB8B56_20395 [Crocinitomicaceae bacterium]
MLEKFGIDLSDLSAENLKLERKRLLLEIQLSDTQTIEVGNRSIVKNDIILLFDQLDDIDSLPHHLQIYENKPLLTFLEDTSLKNVPENTKRLHFETYDEKVVFDYFVSPYLANAYHKALSKAIRTLSFDEFERVLCFSNLMIEQDGLFAFGKFETLCEFLSLRLNGTQSQGLFPFKEFSFLWNDAFYAIANKANEYFQGITDYLAVTLINFTIDQNLSPGRSNYLYKISLKMQGLKCSKDVRDNIWYNTEEFKTESLVQITPSFGIRKIYLAVIAVILIFLICALIF